jgi:hypothetical protein
MDLMKLPSILMRWWWVIASVVVLTGLIVGFRLHRAQATYQTQVRIQITAPQGEEVPLFDTESSSSSFLRDDLVLVRNNLLAVVQSGEVYNRTGQQLDLQDQDWAYTVDVRSIPDSNFVDLLVSARTPALAQAIADVHAVQAIRYYGELRAKPAAATKSLLAEQIDSTWKILTSGSSGQSDTTAAPAQIQQARDTYQLLLKKMAEVTLAEENALRATYIQIAEPAATPTRSTSAATAVGIVGLALVGSVGFGLLLALGLESFLQRRSGAVESRPRCIPLRAPHAGHASESANGAIVPPTAINRVGGLRR